MTNLMKAAVVRAFGEPLSIDEVPVPTVRRGEILVKIAASGVCHTDVHAADGDWLVKPALPFIPGMSLRSTSIQPNSRSRANWARK